MAGVKPVRLQLSRKAGFDLQKLSRSTNGLAAFNVARPSKFGNPFRVTPTTSPERAVARYRAWAWESSTLRMDTLLQLRGKNLACWCKPGAPCHADVLLDLANR